MNSSERPAQSSSETTSPEAPTPIERSIDDVFDTFIERSDVETAEWAIARGLRVSQYVKDFGHNRITSPLADIAKLIGLNELSQGKSHRRAAIRAYKCFEPGDDALLEYADGTLADFHLIDEFLEQKKTDFLAAHPRDSLTNPWLAQIVPGDMDDINLLMQTDDTVYPKCQGVDAKSILVKATAALDTIEELLAQDNPSEDELLAIVFEIESFYAPMCELNHYKGLAMKLRDEATRLAETRGPRAERAIKAMEEARQDLHELLPPIAYDHVLAGDILSHLQCTSDMRPSIGHTTRHGISVGSGNGEYHSDNYGRFPISARYRRKTQSSYAKKTLDGEERKKPRDPFALTVVVDTVDEVQSLFQQLGSSIESTYNSHITPQNSRSRNTAYHIAGSEDFLARMTSAISSDEYGVTLHTRKTTNGFEVAKATFIYHLALNGKVYGVPSELQIQTRNARDIANAGEASHAFKESSRYNPSPAEIEAIQHIHSRGDAVAEPDLTPQSMLRAKEFRRQMDEVQTSTMTLGEIASRRRL